MYDKTAVRARATGAGLFSRPGLRDLPETAISLGMPMIAIADTLSPVIEKPSPVFGEAG